MDVAYEVVMTGALEHMKRMHRQLSDAGLNSQVLRPDDCEVNS
jgi:hypothetical protein